MNVGNNIAKFRKEKKLTQEELAKLINVSPKTISSYENNRNLPNIEILILLSEALDVKIDDILGINKENNFELKNKYEKKTNKGIIMSLSVSIYSLIYFFLLTYMTSGSIITTSTNSLISLRELIVILSKFSIFYVLSIAFFYFVYYFENKKTKAKVLMFTLYFIVLFFLILLIIIL